MATIAGTSGNDSLSGTSDNDTIYGLAGNDTVAGGAGNDYVDGNEGIDWVEGGAGNDTLSGGSGQDHYVFREAGAATADLLTNFAPGWDDIQLDAAGFSAIGASGRFASGDARFFAGAGATTGHDADDRIIYNTSTGQLFYDADGSGSGAAQLIGTIQGAPALNATDINVFGTATPPPPADQTINGTAGNDSLVGTDGNDTINGLAGNDTLDGSMGRDTLNGGAGNDSLIGGHSDPLGGSEGGDLLIGGDGDDTLDGFNSRTFTTDPDIDTMDGGLGNDLYYVDNANDVLSDAGGTDTIYAKNMSWTLASGFENLIINNGGTEGHENGIGNEFDNVLDGSHGWGLTLEGRGGNDTILGSVQSDSLLGGDGNDSIDGGDDYDVLDGGAGNDTLYGGFDDEDDTMTGGAGADTFVVARPSSFADRITDFASGTDKIQLDGQAFANAGPSGNYAAGDERFYAAAGATAAHDATDRVIYNTNTGDVYYDEDGVGGTAAVRIATAPSLAAGDIVVINGSTSTTGQVFNGTAGNDTITGTFNNDTINGLGGDDNLNGSSGNDVVDGGTGNDWVTGGNGADSLVGGDGNDTLSANGDGWVDTLDGGLGNDVYAVDFFDVVLADPGGIDRIEAVDGDWTLGAGLENLLLAGNSGGHTGTGNDLDNIIQIQAGGGGTRLFGLGGNDSLDGNGGNDSLDGGVGNDTLNGWGGNDTITGGAGADLFRLNQPPNAGNADFFTDFTSGTDEILLDATWMPALGTTGNFATNDARFYGAAGASGGHDADDRIVYNTTMGQLYYDADGNGSGAATLIATLQGGASLAATDIAVENGTAAGATIDGTSGNDSLTGGTGNDTINGFAGNDTLDGGPGADSMVGGAGDDVYFVDNTGDLIVEQANEGIDEVRTAISYALPGFVNNLTLLDSAAINGTGNAIENVITGNTAANVLSGGDANDTLIGGSGPDTISGGAGADSFVFNVIGGPGNADQITDFASGVDKIRLDATVMTALGASGNFASGDARFYAAPGANAAHDADDRVVYNTTTGELWYDQDGSGTAGPWLIDTLQGAPAIVATDIAVDNGSAPPPPPPPPSPGQTIFGTAGNDSLVGTTGNDTMYGLAGNDTVVGGAGNDMVDGNEGVDWVEGGVGNDTLSGASGQDHYVFREAGAANADTMANFASAWDDIRLDGSTLSGLGAAGRFSAGDVRFYAAPDASGGHDADDRVVFNSTTGQLFYDADGSGAGAAQLLGTLQAGGTIAAGDIWVI